MASPQKIAWAKLKVGLMTLAALVVLGVLIFQLTGDQNLFADKVKIYTLMDDSAALAPGSPVRLNGILIGEVQDVTLSGESKPGRIIRIHMEVDQDKLRLIPKDSIAAISAENVLGTKFINIKKGQSPEHVQAGGEIAALDTREFDEVVQQGYSLLTSLQGILKRVDAIVQTVEVGQGSIGKLLKDEELYNRLLAMVSEGQKITAALSTDRGTIGKLIYDDALYNDVRGTLARLDTVVLDLQQGKGTAGKFLKDEALYNESRQTIAELRTLVADLNAGKGTAGKLLKSEELHTQIRGTLGKVDLLIDKINSGQGTIGQLLVNQQLYDNMNGATRELQSLFKDIRANPKKFLRVKLSLF